MDFFKKMMKKQFELTGKCNLRCEYCYNQEQLDKWDELALDFVLDEAGEKNLIFLGGGEPILYPRIEELVKELIKKENLVVLSTNATVYAEFENNPNLFIQTSLPCIDPALYMEITKSRNNNLGNVLNNITKYRRKHDYRTYVNFVAYERNIAELEAVSKFCRETNIPLIVSRLIHVPGINPANEDALRQKCLELIINGHELILPEKSSIGVKYFRPMPKQPKC